eukprot:sb/3463226/
MLYIDNPPCFVSIHDPGFCTLQIDKMCPLLPNVELKVPWRQIETRFFSSFLYIQSDPDLGAPDLGTPRFRDRILFPRYRKLTLFDPDLVDTPDLVDKNLPPRVSLNRGPTFHLSVGVLPETCRDQFVNRVSIESRSCLICSFPGRCSHPSGTMQGEIELDNQSGSDPITRTVISSSIALQETLCYRILNEYTDHTGRTKTRELLYTLDYDSLKHVYNYKNQYNFKIPQTKISCWCDCPGGSNQCDSNTDSCGLYNHGSNGCVNWYADGQTLDGCIWVTGAGQTCCSVNIEPFNAYTYKAVEISSPITRAQLRLNVWDVSSTLSKPPSLYILGPPNISNEPVSCQVLPTDRALQGLNITTSKKHLKENVVYNIDLDTGTTADEMVTLNIATSSTASLLPAGWYFGSMSGSELRTNVKINGLNEWNMNKLGWYKVQDGYDTIRESTVREAFVASTENCGENKLKTNFAAAYYNRFPEEAEHVSTFLYSKVGHVVRNDSARQVIAFHRSSPRLEIKLTFRKDNKVSMIYDKSEMEDFHGTIFLDKFSNRYLNITVMQAAGSIIGNIKLQGYERDSFYIYVKSKKPTTQNAIVRISSACQ